jgi:hypothetical protein
MSEYVIESGIPMPSPVSGPGVRKYPFDRLEVGQSFYLSGKEKDFSTLRNAAFQHARRYGKKFITRRVDGGARCWRIA